MPTTAAVCRTANKTGGTGRIDTVATSIFDEKGIVPNETMLAGVLADSKVFWEDIKDYAVLICGTITTEWKFYSKKAGWTLTLKSGKRTILYLIPQDKFFKVNFVLGKKAVNAALDAGLPSSVTALIENAASYTEGRSFMFDVTGKAQADTAKKLIEIKNGN